MDFSRTEEQAELASTVRALLTKRSDSEAVRAAIRTDEGYDVDLWRALCEQIGVAALPIPEQYDGFGASLNETAVVLEELGENLTPAPLLSTSIATTALLLFGSESAKSELLPGIAAGEIATLADGELVLDAVAATHLIRINGDTLQLVEGAAIEPVEAMDQTLRFGRVSGGIARTVGTITNPAPLQSIGLALTSALQVGAMQRGVDMTVSYSKERVQFGRPIGSFQALKHRMADMLVLLESARSASWGATATAAACLAEPTHENTDSLHRHAGIAAAYCTDALDQIASETVQLHGGIAITWEHDAHLLFKRAHALGQLFGQPAEHRAALI